MMDEAKKMTKEKKNGFKQQYVKETVFILSVLVLPIAWWAFGFFYVTGESILLAFQAYNIEEERFIFVGLDNFVTVVRSIGMGGELGVCLKNSFMLWCINTFVTLPISLLISFALYKNVIGTGFYKVILFLPQVVSSMVWVLVFKYLVEYGVPKIFPDLYVKLSDTGVALDLLQNPKTNLGTLVFYQQWITLASGMIIYTGAMSRIPVGLVEAGHLDGMKNMDEFIHITLPLIFPTLSVTLTTCVISIFSATLPTYQFYDGTSTTPLHLWTMGHYMFAKVMNGTSVDYPMVSAVSLVVTMIAAPITLFTRNMLEKYGPETEY